MNNNTIVPGSPHNTPNANLLNTVAVSPWTYSHIILNKLTSGSAAMIPPYAGNLRASSVTAAMTNAEAIIFPITFIFWHTRLKAVMIGKYFLHPRLGDFLKFVSALLRRGLSFDEGLSRLLLLSANAPFFHHEMIFL